MFEKNAVIIGAGPAGLSAAYHILKSNIGIKPIIVESLDCVGGIARTIFYEGGGTDIGPHRLFSKNQKVLDFWESLLPLAGKPAIDDKLLNRECTVCENGPDPEEEDNVMLKRRRFSRIFYLGKFFDYPLKLKPQTFMNMGLARTFAAGFSYLHSAIWKINPEVTLEDFMINRFGRVLYSMFFEKYTEKVWGLHPSKISKEWGEQRIKGLSLFKAVFNAIFSVFCQSKETTLIDEYFYPKYGCSQLWNAIASEILKMGGEIRFNSTVTGFEFDGKMITGVKVNSLENQIIINSDMVISSMPISELISNLGDNVPVAIRDIAQNLPYRDFILASYYCKNVNIPNGTGFATINDIAPDSWIYLQDERIEAGRADIMNNCSPYVVKDFENHVILNMEYFCSVGDSRWNMSDEQILDFGISELEKLNFVKSEDVEARRCIRVEKAYPAYFGVYKNFGQVKDYLNSIENLYCIGRNGQHKYNNMDHSILSGIECANAIAGKIDKKLVWDVNTEQEYHEAK